MMAVKSKKLKAEEGVVKKIIATVKKAMAKEFLWLLFVLALSIPLALIGYYIIHFCVDSSGQGVTIIEQEIAAEIREVSQIIYSKHPTFMMLYMICVFGIYFSRMVVAAIQTQLEDKE